MLKSLFLSIRQATVELAAPLSPEDMTVQSMPDASPTKWHLAHITWFFENFILKPHATGYEEFDSEFGFLFNSYYYSVGSMYARPRRGLVTRPSVQRVFDYRKHVDEAMVRLLEANPTSDVMFLASLGLHHEQQHQELILTDLKHLLFQNPMFPRYRQCVRSSMRESTSMNWATGKEGIHEVGFKGNGFCFDNETPRHRILLSPHAMADRLITNGEYREFIQDGGYNNSELWLSDGWAKITTEEWKKPFYWHDDLEREFTLNGLEAMDLNTPVTHLSFYEADAFARWAGCRLPTEFEWEVYTDGQTTQGNFVESNSLHPQARTSKDTQVFGDVWEWTMSAYTPYPGFQPLEGSLGEYNGKFMSSQMILRGGSCVTPQSHIRATYRNFFYPDARWQFSGLRLAKDI
ncbi:MAG: ergothioneine biosynthesis protein EgtB [Pseudomonadota bacterium]